MRLTDGALPLHDPVAMNALLNSYATGEVAGLHVKMPGILSLVGDNGRRLLVVDQPDGVYVGGACITDPSVLRSFATILLSMATDREAGMHGHDLVAGSDT